MSSITERLPKPQYNSLSRLPSEDEVIQQESKIVTPLLLNPLASAQTPRITTHSSASKYAPVAGGRCHGSMPTIEEEIQEEPKPKRKPVLYKP